MTTDREAACWLMAALLVVVLTFSAAGCGTRPPSTAAAEAPFTAAAPTTRWTINDEADALPNLVAAAERAGVAERDRAAALGFDDLEIDAPPRWCRCSRWSRRRSSTRWCCQMLGCWKPRSPRPNLTLWPRPTMIRRLTR